MKILLAIAALALCAASASAGIVFQGYMTIAEKSLFVLSVDNVRTSGWLAVGQQFNGISIVAFDSKNELLTVEKDGKRQTIHLVDGKTPSKGDTPSPVARKPIVISIGTGENISVGDDVAMLDALKRRFEIAAATVPQPAITLRPPADVPIARLSLIMDLLRTSGIKRFDLSSP